MCPRRVESLLMASILFSALPPAVYAQAVIKASGLQTVVPGRDARSIILTNPLPINEALEDTIDVLPELGLPVGGLDRLSNVIVIPQSQVITPIGMVNGFPERASFVGNGTDGLVGAAIDAGAADKLPVPVNAIIEHSKRSVDQVIRAVIPR